MWARTSLRVTRPPLRLPEIWLGSRSCSVIQPADAGGAIRGDARDDRRSGSPRASTSSESTTSRANVRAAQMADAIVRGLAGGRRDRSHRPRRHGLPGAPWRQRLGEGRGAALRGGRRARARPRAGRASTTTWPRRSTTARCTTRSARSSSDRRSTSSRPWPRPSPATFSASNRRAREVIVRVRKPEVQPRRPARLRRRGDPPRAARRLSRQRLGAQRPSGRVPSVTLNVHLLAVAQDRHRDRLAGR